MEYISSIVTGLICLYLGHLLTVKYEKRKEFNLLAEPILDYLDEINAHLDMRYSSNIGRNKILRMEQVDKIIRRLGFIRKPKFIKLLEQYNEVIEYIIKNPAPFIGKFDDYIDRYDEAKIKTKKLMNFLKLK